MVKVNWFPGNEAARKFRDSNVPGIVFKYAGAFTTEREAIALIEKLKRQGKQYRKQQRVNPDGGRYVHVVFEGVPKGQAKRGRSHTKTGLMKPISVNVSDLSRFDDFSLKILLQPVIKSKQIVNAEPERVDGHAVILDCDRERALAIVGVIRMKFSKSQLRCYDGKKRI